QDVGHDHERGQPGLRLRGQVRAAFLELEEAGEAAGRSAWSWRAGLRFGAHRDADLLARATRAETHGRLGPRGSRTRDRPSRPRSRSPPGPDPGPTLRISYSSSRASRPSNSIWT